MKLSLVIPCYNEEENVKQFYEETEKAFAGAGFDYEYVFVNDGSRDQTLAKLKELYQTAEANLRIVSFSRNFGKESAIYAGLSNAVGEYVTVIDADLQQRPEVALQMVRILEEKPEVDCVAAFQDVRKEPGLLVWFKDQFYKLINKMTSVPFVNGASDFRTFRRPMLDAILSLSEYHRFSKGLFSWVGFETEFIPYEVMERQAGSSKWSFVKLFKYAIEGIVAFTTVPLQLATALGTLSVAGGFIYYVIALILKLCGHVFNPFGCLTAFIAIMSGLILATIGILGEYLSKIYLQVKARPIYIAKEILVKEKDHE